MAMESFKSSPAEKEEDKLVPKSPREKKLMDKLRKRLMVAFLLGTSAFMEACGGMTPQDVEKVPEVSIQEVIKDPAQAAKLKMIRVEGYPVMTGKDQMEIPVPIFDTDAKGRLRLKRFDYITKDVEAYDIHETSDVNSPSIRAFVEGDTVYFPHVPLHIPNEQLAPHLHSVAGTLKEIKSKGEKKYYLEVRGTVDHDEHGDF